MNRLDEVILHGRDPHRPVTLLAYERLRYAAVAAILILGFGLAVLLLVVANNVAADRTHADLDRRVTHLEQEIANLKE